jgi:hypothetical protein
MSLPLAVSFGVYAFSVDHLIKDINDESWTTLRNVAFNPDAADQFMRDVGGRIQFGIASGLMRIAAAAATALTIIVLARRIGSSAAISIAAVLVTVCTAFYFTALTLEQPHAFAGKSRVAIGYIYEAARPGGFKNIDQAIRLNILASLVGGISLLAAFAAVALRARHDDNAAADLQGRMRDLERTTIFCAAFLVLLTALNKTLVDWTQAVLDEHHQKAYAYLAGAISTYWGTFGTLVLVSALVPAFVGLRLDIDKSARAWSEDQEEANRWKKDHGLEFDMKSGIGAAIAAAAPMLTVPGIELASKLLH